MFVFQQLEGTETKEGGEIKEVKNIQHCSAAFEVYFTVQSAS